MKKKIAYIINSKIYSGLENVAITIIEEMKYEYDFIYVTQKGPIVDVLKEKKINYYIIERMSPREIKKFIKNWQPDILHAHDYTASVICSLVKGKLPLIEHLHNNSPWLKKINKNSLAFLFAAIKANKILTVSDSIKDEYIFSRFISNKIINISNPVSREKILNFVNKRYEKKYDICCVGRLNDAKDPIRFITIIKKIALDYPELKVLWVGNGEMYNEVIEYSKKNGLEEIIKFVGYKKNPYKYMAKAKIFMLTSKWEGYGLVSFEALALGLPCIVSNVGGLPEIVDNRCGKLCNDNEEFIDISLKLLKDNNLRKVYSNNAIEKSKKLENYDEYIKNINRIYKKVEKQ